MNAISPKHSLKISDIQVLRGIAVVMVLIGHNGMLQTLLELLPRKISFELGLGVDLFFVISGYVIATSLQRDRFEPLSFLCKRFFRLVPVLLVFIGLNALMHLFLRSRDLPAWIGDNFLTDWSRFGMDALSVLGGYATLRPQIGYTFGPMWSLSVEDQFYAALALACLAATLLVRRRAYQVLPFLLFAAASGLYLYLLSLRLDCLVSGKRLQTSAPFWQYLIRCRADLLPLGVALAFIGQWKKDQLRRFFEVHGPSLTPWLLVIPIGLGGATPLGEGKHVTGLTLPIAGWCFGLLVLAAGCQRAFPASRGRVYRFWVYCGDRSYTLYVLHLMFIPLTCYLVQIGGREWAFHPATRFYAVQTGLTLILLLPLVEFIYRKIELPLTGVGRRLSSRLRIVPESRGEPSPSIPIQQAA